MLNVFTVWKTPKLEFYIPGNVFDNNIAKKRIEQKKIANREIDITVNYT